jgi:molecular chaperone GrpE (heat shock protein)
MLRFLGLIVLLIGAFGLGYTWGQRPLANLEQVVKDLSKRVVDTTTGIEQDLRQREGFVNAKARIVQAKAELLNRNTANAVKELAEAIDSLETATRSAKPADPSIQAKELTGKLRQIRSDLTRGKKEAAARLDGIQREVDVLLDR